MAAATTPTSETVFNNSTDGQVTVGETKGTEMGIYNISDITDTSGQKEETLITSMTSWAASFDEATDMVKQFEEETKSKFILYWIRSHDISKSKLHWEQNSKMPYLLLKTTALECQHGKDRNKQTNAKRKMQKSLTEAMSPRSSKITIQASKKTGCKAMIKILDVVKFPQHQRGRFVRSSSDRLRKTKVAAITHHKKKQARNTIMEAIRTEDEKLQKVYGCYVCFPSANAHTGHAIGEEKSDFGYNENVPHFLRHRSKKVVRHCMRRMACAEEATSDTIYQDDTVFCFKNELDNEMSTVYFETADTTPKCTCQDFTRHSLPCKHMFSIHKIYPDLASREMSVVMDRFESTHKTRKPRVSHHRKLSAGATDKSVAPPLSYDDGFANNQVLEVVEIGPDEVDEVQNKSDSIQQSITNISSLLPEISNVLYSVNSYHLLEQTEACLQSVQSNLETIIRNLSEGTRYPTLVNPGEPVLVSPSEVTEDELKRKTCAVDALPRKAQKYNRYIPGRGLLSVGASVNQ